jgi:hypothetical protein
MSAKAQYHLINGSVDAVNTNLKALVLEGWKPILMSSSVPAAPTASIVVFVMLEKVE